MSNYTHIRIYTHHKCQLPNISTFTNCHTPITNVCYYYVMQINKTIFASSPNLIPSPCFFSNLSYYNYDRLVKCTGRVGLRSVAFSHFALTLWSESGPPVSDTTKAGQATTAPSGGGVFPAIYFQLPLVFRFVQTSLRIGSHIKSPQHG